MNKNLKFKTEADTYLVLKAKYKSLIETSLKDFFKNFTFEEPLNSAIKHFIFPGGKYLRPLLSLFFAKDIKVSDSLIESETLPLALAVELIHTSTLIHDDLPCMDDDDERRGIKTCHKEYGEAIALLAGDTLISLALQMALKSSANLELKTKAIYQITSAYTQVCRGQALDIINYSDKTKLNNLKTGKLFEASFLLPAFKKISSKNTLKLISDFSLNFGNYYQLLDDYIDVFGTSEKRGRSKSSDIKNKKETKTISLKKEEAFKNLENVFNSLLDNLNTIEKEISIELNEDYKFYFIRNLLFDIAKRAY